MKFCRNCGSKLINNTCANCQEDSKKKSSKVKYILISLLAVAILFFGALTYKNKIENEFLLDYHYLYSDSTKTVPHEDLDMKKIKNMEKKMWAVSGDTTEFKRELIIVKEKISIRDEVNELFNEIVPSNFDTSELTIRSNKRIETPIVEGEGTYSKGITWVINYYNSQWDSFERVNDLVNSFDAAIIDLTDINYLEGYVYSIEDQTLLYEAQTMAQDIINIKNDFENYFNENIGTHFTVTDKNSLDDIYLFNYPEYRLAKDNFQGHGSDGSMDMIKYDMKNKIYYVMTSLTSAGDPTYDLTVTPITIIDGETISINNKIAIFDPFNEETTNIFFKNPSSEVDRIKKVVFDTSVNEISSTTEAEEYISRLVDSVNQTNESFSYTFLGEKDDFYHYTLSASREQIEFADGSEGNLRIYKDGYVSIAY